MKKGICLGTLPGDSVEDRFKLGKDVGFDGIEIGKASAVCTTNVYHFTENSISSAKQFMKQNNIHVRV